MLLRNYPPWLIHGSAAGILLLWGVAFALSFLDPQRFQIPAALNVVALGLLGALHGLNKGAGP